MKCPARPRRANGGETSPCERDHNGSKYNQISPVVVHFRLERGCGVGSAGDPFVVEIESDGNGDYGCDVESENGDAEAEGDASAAGSDADVWGRLSHLVFHVVIGARSDWEIIRGGGGGGGRIMTGR